MIKINGEIVNIEHFSDGSQKLVNIHIHTQSFDKAEFNRCFNIVWKYENESELVSLIYLVNHIRDTYTMCKNYITLRMLWVPNARMDRVENPNDVFTLKYFAQIINSLNFDKVTILDPHSRVTNALIDRIEVIPAEYYIKKAINDIIKNYCFETDFNKNIVMCFPDNGAFERYASLPCFDGFKKVVGKKHRDWNTGKIQNLELSSDNSELDGKNAFIVDDMISSGETLYQFIKKLKDCGVLQIYVYCSHLENRIMTEPNNNLRSLLETGTIRFIYTTDSLFSGEYHKIKILEP